MSKENLTVKKSVIAEYITKTKVEVMSKKAIVPSNKIKPSETENEIIFDNSDAEIMQMKINLAVVEALTEARKFFMEQ